MVFLIYFSKLDILCHGPDLISLRQLTRLRLTLFRLLKIQEVSCASLQTRRKSIIHTVRSNNSLRKSIIHTL
jgi:hypothetical protein